MGYHKPPTVSRKRVNHAGESLKRLAPANVEYQSALEVANAWRLAHVYPINTFQARLRKMVCTFSESLVAQRLKRMPTIIDKLHRHPNMKLSTMQDIGGVRAVLKNLGDVYSVVSLYENSKRFSHILKDKKDYIEHPKSDGYRGIHLIYRYNNTLARGNTARQYEGLMVEVQIRTKEQHIWATAVEAMGTILGQPIKTHGGTDDWQDFFALMSSAIAMVESSNVLDAHSKMEPLEIYRRIAFIAEKIKALDLMSGYNLAANLIETRHIGYYNLIVLYTSDKKVAIKGYSATEYEKAVNEYSRIEQKSGDNVDVVLVSAGKLRQLKQAYPNYFLDIREFVKRVNVIIDVVTENKKVVL